MICVPKLYAQATLTDSLNNTLIKYTKEDNYRARILYQLSTQYIYSEPKKTLELINQLIGFENKIKDKNIVSSAYRIKGIALYYLSSFEQSLAAMQTAYRMDLQTKNRLGLPGDLSCIAMVYMAQNNYPLALNYYLQASKLYEHIPELQSDAHAVYGNIGLIYLEMKNYNMALMHFNKSLATFRKLKNQGIAANMLANIGNVHFRQHNYQKAIYYSRQSLNISDSIGDKMSSARETGNMSSYYNGLGQSDEALKFGLKAVELNRSIGNKRSEGYNLQNIASAYQGKGDYAKAISYGIASLNRGKNLNILEIIRDASQGLSETYEKKGIADSSLFYYKQYTLFKDSISNDQKTQEITRLNIQYDFDKKESAYKIQQVLSNEKLKQQQLQLALNNAEIQKSIQTRDLQKIQLQNEKLLSQEKEKKLVISVKNEKLQSNKVKALSQEQQLNKLRLNQLWLFGILSIVVLISVSLFLLNLYRIRQLRYKNKLQKQEAEQQSRELIYQHHLSESELKAIRVQMNPHFIFNVLNSIESYIMDNDRVVASRLIQKFAALSRLILENSVKSLVTADKEWKAIQLYTELQAIRYGDAFCYQFSIDEAVSLPSLLLPPMLIQPLIENSIHHGIIPEKGRDNRIEVKFEQRETDIRVTVTDNGVGLSNSSPTSSIQGIKEKSMGLESIRERIEMINIQYGQQVANFSIRDRGQETGTIAVLTLPLLFKGSSKNLPVNV